VSLLDVFRTFGGLVGGEVWGVLPFWPYAIPDEVQNPWGGVTLPPREAGLQPLEEAAALMSGIGLGDEGGEVQRGLY
jgi:hypothetical protein